jgi:hypothetical protein
MTSRPTQTMCLVVAAVALGASLAARSAEAQQAGPTPQERVAALKQSMQESQTKNAGEPDKDPSVRVD